MAVVTPTDRPKSVRNRCVVELFVVLFVLSLCSCDISVGVGAFVIGLSQISSFFSLCKIPMFIQPNLKSIFLRKVGHSLQIMILLLIFDKLNAPERPK